MPKTEWLLASPTSATNSKADTTLFRWLAKLIRGEDLSAGEADDFFSALIDPNSNPAQISAALAALTTKGETVAELAGMANAMRGRAIQLTTRHTNLIDTSGTGSSAAKTFNVSTAAAFVVAGAGLPVAQQINRGGLSGTGSADVLSKLGVKVQSEPHIVQACLNGAGICFLFAPKFHSATRRVADIRRTLGIRTCLNLLGILANPLSVSTRVIGVWHASLLEPLAQALALLGTERAWVVSGADGLDELTLTGETHVAELADGKLRTFDITPEDFGIHRAAINHLRCETPDQSAKIIREVLSGKRRDEARALVVLNAAAALLTGGLAQKPVQATRLAEQSIDSASAQVKLERLIQTTNKKMITDK